MWWRSPFDTPASRYVLSPRGAEALTISSSNPMPDIVVLDVMLPDIDGFEVCRRLRGDQNDLPVLFLTARGTCEVPTGCTG